ncbi:uncharacterized protein LOC107039698 [Diachasma alloeum]|uniref:uncharacterized protein LOC107039698 n=1 Tax=Diachasma alloeum TaxID=454923 RepID=UPI000738189C|nr:uncharacterized protein LOC107039698 [Diachasma alloeum]
MRGCKREWRRLFGVQARVNLFRCDRPMGATTVPRGLMEYVGRVLGEDPDYRALMRVFDTLLFGGKLRGYTLWRSKDFKDTFGYTDFLQRKIFLQECLFSAGLSRTVLVRIILHELCHAYVDVMGGDRMENQLHGFNWKREVIRVNEALQCDIEDESDVDWKRLRRIGLDKLYICERCGLRIIRMIKWLPDAKFFSWFPRHANRCGGEFKLS